jgi:hypothetical protein
MKKIPTMEDDINTMMEDVSVTFIDIISSLYHVQI